MRATGLTKKQLKEARWTTTPQDKPQERGNCDQCNNPMLKGIHTCKRYKPVQECACKCHDKKYNPAWREGWSYCGWCSSNHQSPQKDTEEWDSIDKGVEK